MRLPKYVHAVLGVLVGMIFFLIGIAVLSAAFVAAYMAIQWSKPFVTETFHGIMHMLGQWIPS